MGDALKYAMQLLGTLPQLISAGVEITGVIQRGRQALAAMQAENRAPTAQEWDELNAEIARLRGQLRR